MSRNVKTGAQTFSYDPWFGLPVVFSEADLRAMRACRVLIIDDEPLNVLLLERVLTLAGFDNFISTTDSREASALFLEFQPDLVLTDWLMPEVDGCAVIEQVRAAIASDDYLPIVVLTADVTPQVRKRALAVGATDFLTKPFDQIEVLLRIQNLLKARLSHLIIQRQNAELEQSVRQRTAELERTLVELRDTQAQVIQQERLAALGTMAGGIAHDFNNALSIIIGFSEVLLREMDTGLTKANATAPVSTILTAAEDAARIVHRLREFYRPDHPADPRLPVDLNRLIEQAVTLTQPRWKIDAMASGREITMRTENLRQIPDILGDAVELREVLTNLIFNAVDAIPDRGEISWATDFADGLVILKVHDTGIGMTEEVQRRCLEPFFTTKGKSGTGLGLSMVFGIMQRHGGAIQIESEPDRGTTFTLRLPSAQSAVPVETEAAPAGSSEPMRVLVVDDQPMICQLLSKFLREDLHTIESAHNGDEALEKFRASDFDLVITDHVMAGMTGILLASAIKSLDPAVPVVLLTGYGSGVTTTGQPGQTVDLVLEKPLTRVALRQAFAKVRRIVARRGVPCGPPGSFGGALAELPGQ